MRSTCDAGVVYLYSYHFSTFFLLYKIVALYRLLVRIAFPCSLFDLFDLLCFVWYSILLSVCAIRPNYA